MRFGFTVALVAIAGTLSAAQIQRPPIALTPSVKAAKTSPGAPITASLRVVLPKDIHVQSNTPREASLIATELTLSPPPGVIVEKISYPAASDLQQAGRREPLAVLGPEFVIDVQLTLTAAGATGDIRIPGQLRYQACSSQMCFPPARASTEWVIARP